MNEPTHLDLFSGIGGFSIAAEKCGFKTIGFSEIDPYASAVLSEWWPNVTNYGDIRNIKDIGNVDLITGGFPCQPFSVAGKRCGDSDERFLWPEIVRVMREVRPRFTLFENVPGLLTIDGGRTFNRMLSDISSLGYDLLWNCVPASAVGANHQRDRLWIIAISNPKSLLGGKKLGDESKRILQDVAHSRCEPERNEERRIDCERINSEAQRVGTKEGHRFTNSRQVLADSNRPGFGERCRAKPISKEQPSVEHYGSCSGWPTEEEWFAKSGMGRVANDVSHRVDRLRCLGNAIVPQVAEIFLKEIRRMI